LASSHRIVIVIIIISSSSSSSSRNVTSPVATATLQWDLHPANEDDLRAERSAPDLVIYLPQVTPAEKGQTVN